MGLFNSAPFNTQTFGGPGAATSQGQGLIKVSDLLYAAYRSAALAQVLRQPQRGMSPEEITEGLQILNFIADQWNSQRLTIWTCPRVIQNVQAGQQTYLIGSGATDPNPDNIAWDMPRPPKIERAGMIIQSNQPTPLELPVALLTLDDWADIPIKGTQSTFGLWAYYDFGGTTASPYGNFNIWPVPQQENQIALYVWQQLSQFNDASLGTFLPPGYSMALYFSIAKQLCIRWGKPISQDLRDEYNQAIAWVKSLNVPQMDAICDPATWGPNRGYWNYITGDWQRR